MSSIRITPSMTIDTVYPWLEMYAKNEASLCLVEQKIELELAMKGVTFRDTSVNLPRRPIRSIFFYRCIDLIGPLGLNIAT